MRSRYFFAGGIVLFLLLSMTVITSNAYAVKGKFFGVVKNTAGQGISGPQMQFQGPQNYSCNRYPTGDYLTIDLTPGYYTITVTASGYQTIVDQNVYLPSGGRIQKNYTMQPQMMQLQGTQAERVASLEDDNVSTPELPAHAIQMLGDIKGQILSLDPAAFKTPDRQDALVKKYDTAIRNIQEGRNDLALKKIQYGILMRTNGCNRLGRSDDNDWIIDCEVQKLVYDNTAVVKEIGK